MNGAAARGHGGGRHPRRRRLGMLLVLVALLAAAPGCGSGDAPTSTEKTVPTAGPASTDGTTFDPSDIGSFALALGVEPLDAAAVERLGAYDLVVVDGGSTGREQVTALHDAGSQVLAYLSVGTVEPYRPWFARAQDEGWLLERWPDWDEWYVDTSIPEFRDLMVEEAARELAAGFDGLFLDNTDMVSEHPDQRAGMTELVAALDELVGDRLLFAQNGDTTVGAIAAHLDGWNREDVSSTYDFETEAYGPVSDDDHRSAVATLAELRDRGLLVTATDYTAADDDPMTAGAVDAACQAGVLPFVSDIGLTRIPDTPARCP